MLELIRYFILFDGNVKKICRYQQYFAIQEIMKTIALRDGKGNRQSGVVWHTQGSGKSLTMVMLAKYILMELAPLSPACGHRNRPQRVGRADRCHILQYKTEPRPCQQWKAPREVGWQR